MTIALHLKNKVLTFLFILNTSQWLFLPDNDGAGVEAGHPWWKRRQASRGIQTSVPLPGEDVDRLPACFSSVLSHLSFFLSSSFTLFYIKRDLFSLLISPHYIKNCFFFFSSFSYFSLLSHSQSPESGKKNISLGSFLYIRKVHCAIQYNPDKPREKSKMESALGFYSTTKNWNRCPNFAIVKELRHRMPNLRKHC